MNISNKCKIKIAFFISLCIFLIYCILKNNTTFYYDAKQYFELSNSFYDSGRFSLTRFYPKSIRGYFLPLLIFIFSKLGQVINSDFFGIWLMNSLSFSIICIIILSIILEKRILSVSRIVLGTISYCIFVLIFFNGFLVYPLSDNIAIMLFLIGIFFINKTFENCIFDKIKFIFVGLLLYGCYNTRTSYLISIAILILIFILINLKSKKEVFINILFIIIGIFITSLPQMIINNIHMGVYSPLISIEYSKFNSLNLAQLYWGIDCNSYRTSVDMLSNYPQNGIFSSNQAGRIIKLVEDITPQNMTYWVLIKLVLKYPIEFFGIYFSHIVNLLFIFDPEVYISNMNKKLTSYFIISSIVIYLNIFFIFIINKKKLFNPENKKCFLYICPVITALLIIPGAVETRFFIYIHLLMYLVIAFIIDYRRIVFLIKKYCVKVILTFAILVGSCASILNFSLASLSPEPITFSVNKYSIGIKEQLDEQLKNGDMPWRSLKKIDKDGYCPPDYSFITKGFEKGKLGFDIIFDKNVPSGHNIKIYVNGVLYGNVEKIEKEKYEFNFDIEPNNISSIQIKCSYEESINGIKRSFKLENVVIE